MKRLCHFNILKKNLFGFFQSSYVKSTKHKGQKFFFILDIEILE